MENSQKLTKELIGLEKKYWQSMVDEDLESAVDLTDFPCMVAGSHGVHVVDQKQFEEMFNSQPQTMKSFKFSGDPEVRLLSPTTAVVAYKVKSVVDTDGKEQQMEAVDTSTWIKRGEKWKCAMHAEAEFHN